MTPQRYKTISYILMALTLVAMVLVWFFTKPDPVSGTTPVTRDEAQLYNMIPVGIMMIAIMLLVQARIKEDR